MSVPLMLVIICVILGMAAGVERAVRGVRAARARARSIEGRLQQQSARLRQAARESLLLGREVRNNRRTITHLQEEFDRHEADLARLAQPGNRVFVLDEKRAAADVAWLVVLQSAPPSPEARQMPPWVGERRFRVWGSEEAGVRAKVERRYPAEAGYQISEVGVMPAAAAPANSNAGG